MSNIVLTSTCNLKCPYCFANEFVNRSNTEITFENYLKAKDFLTKYGEKVIGLIGGEPLLHSRFKDIVRDVIYDTRIEKCTIYTNGINCDKFLDVFSSSKIRFLVNCNSPEDIGHRNYKRLCDNLDEMILNRYMGNRMSLGINMYKENANYDYIINLLKKYNFRHLRVSITVPNNDSEKNYNSVEYFRKMKPSVVSFFHALDDCGIIPHYDCNKMPSCVLTDEERKFMKHLFDKIPPEMRRKNEDVDTVICRPVIDILQDLTAIRCFGLSEVSKVPISDFENAKDLHEYYLREFDAYAHNTASCSECAGCNSRKVAKCTGGCLSYKINDINEMRKKSDSLISAHLEG